MISLAFFFGAFGSDVSPFFLALLWYHFFDNPLERVGFPFLTMINIALISPKDTPGLPQIDKFNTVL